MAREPVAIDFVGLGERGHEERGACAVATRQLVKPVASVPSEYHRLAHMTTAMAVQQQQQQQGSHFRNWAENITTASPFAHPSGGGGGGGGGGGCGAGGLSQAPWVNKRAMAMKQLQGQSLSGLTTGEVADGTRSVGHDPPRWESSAPSSPSHHTMSSSNQFEALAQQLAQQAQKAASIRADPKKQQALRQSNVAIMRAPGNNNDSASGTEPSVGHTSSSTQTAAFGSPIPFYSRMKPGNESGHQQEEVTMAPAHASERLPVGGKQPVTAQLTIFYAGTVNVYDEVPVDKAQAIMLLAGQGSSMSSQVDCRPQARAAQVTVSQPPSRAASPAPQAATTSVGPPPSGSTISNRPAPTTTGVELPQARKASLARFLERRKDRVRKGPYTNRNQELAAQGAARVRLNHDNLPSPSSSSLPPIRRSLSPNENNQAIGGGASTSGEPLSPKPPRQRSMSQERPTQTAPPPPSPSSSPSRGKAVAKESKHPS